ncbi:MAG: PepSY-associated TM helix domain-containing protein [Bacteroidota bacterium]
MDKRSYNIFFDLHTVSGIVISVLLYVIFFAGSFSFFRGEIIAWERNEHAGSNHDFQLDVDAALDTLQKKYDLSTRDISIYQREGEKRLMVSLSAPKDTLLGKDDAFFYIHPETYQTSEYETSYTLGEFLYRLHFFAQIPYPVGYYLSGFTALFFLFAILTGILVHWKKIISNFYLFRPWEKLKTVWTDAHTALGTIGLPFQLVYAVTGAFFMINILLVIPGLYVLYDGDQAKLYNDLGYGSPTYTFENRKLENQPGINEFIGKTGNTWKSMHATEVSIFNYGDEGMHVRIGGELDHGEKFTGAGEITYKASTSEIISKKDPYRPTSYLEGVQSTMYHLHFGSYGGYAVKSISFMLGLVTCFVIITGVLIWLEARNKKHIPEKQRRFNTKVGHIYLALCLTMFPVTAASFIVTMLVPHEFDEIRQTILYNFYFGSWLLLSIFFVWRKDNYITNKYTLLSGAVMGMLVPVTNGIITGNWFWISFARHQFDVFVVDFLWIFISAIAFYAVFKLKRPRDPEEHQHSLTLPEHVWHRTNGTKKPVVPEFYVTNNGKE